MEGMARCKIELNVLVFPKLIDFIQDTSITYFKKVNKKTAALLQ